MKPTIRTMNGLNTRPHTDAAPIFLCGQVWSTTTVKKTQHVCKWKRVKTKDTSYSNIFDL